MTKIRILLNGAAGKMGKAMAAGIMEATDLELVAAVDIRHCGRDMGILAGGEPSGLLIADDLAAAIKANQPDVMVDFTNPQAIMKNLRIALQHNLASVVGTTGLNEHELQEIDNLAKQSGAPVFWATNFALGAVLMMRFAKEAAQYFPHVEVIERHHEQKLDAPSGTALSTLEAIAEIRKEQEQGNPHEFEKIAAARGGNYQGMRVHSVRLHGYVASQEVIFGDTGQILTISHDAVSRESFLPGLLLAVRKIKNLTGLTCGLDKIL